MPKIYFSSLASWPPHFYAPKEGVMQATKYTCSAPYRKFYSIPFRFIQGDSLARGPKHIWEKHSRIWRNAFKCPWM